MADLGDRVGMMKREGGSRIFFSQWSLPVPQQHGSFNFMTTDHCENRLRCFSQWSAEELPGIEPCRFVFSELIWHDLLFESSCRDRIHRLPTWSGNPAFHCTH